MTRPLACKKIFEQQPWTQGVVSGLDIGRYFKSLQLSPTLRKYKTNLHAILSGIPQRQTMQKWKVKVDSVKIFLHKQLFQIFSDIYKHKNKGPCFAPCGCCVDIWTEVMGLKSSRVQGYHRASAAVLSAPAAEKQTAALFKTLNSLKINNSCLSKFSGTCRFEK